MSQLQTNLFQYIKSVVPANLSFVDEIANALEISTDSAYRRIRGEKQVSFEEIQKLSNRFRISIDQVLSLKNDLMLFSGNFIEEEHFDFMKYLDQVVYSNLCYIAGFKQKEFFIFCKDIPLFYYYHLVSRPLKNIVRVYLCIFPIFVVVNLIWIQNFHQLATADDSL